MIYSWCQPLKTALRTGSTIPVKYISAGSQIFNIEKFPDSGGFYARSAGTSAVVMNVSSDVALIKLPSGKLIKVNPNVRATVGSVPLVVRNITILHKAGTSRHMNVRPRVRGEAMNPADHPHGGRTRGGKPNLTPWGKLAKFVKTAL